MRYHKVLLLNCTDPTEPSEAAFLGEFFKMIQLRYPKSVQYKEKEINSKKELRKAHLRNGLT